MTKRDYILIAAVIHHEADEARTRKDITALASVSHIARYMSAKLSHDNPRFDVDRFLSACGVES